MYTYNKNDKSYTFSSDDLDIDNLLSQIENKNEENINMQAGLDDNDANSRKNKNIEVINGGNDLDISPVTDYLEVEKPKNEKKENIVIPENNN